MKIKSRVRKGCLYFPRLNSVFPHFTQALCCSLITAQCLVSVSSLCISLPHYVVSSRWKGSGLSHHVYTLFTSSIMLYTG